VVSEVEGWRWSVSTNWAESTICQQSTHHCGLDAAKTPYSHVLSQ
jgi:hypothetical protein